MKPPARLQLAIADLTHAVVRWHAFHHSLADRTPDGYPSGGDGIRAGIGDPTPGAVLARRRTTETWFEAEALCIEAQAIARRLAVIVDSVGEAPPPDGALRCTGAPDKPWAKPECVGNAVRAGLCWACYERGRRWEMDNGPASFR